MQRHRTVEAYIDNAPKWQDELRNLRKILLSTRLAETVKWGAPCYVHEGKNVVGIGAFKSYVGLWFHQGALLSDPEGVLINAQEGKTKALRQWRFESTNEIKARAIKAYVKEAIELQEQGKEIKPARNKAVKISTEKISAELASALTKNKRAKNAFDELTPGKQREYANYIAEAKREATRESRIKKIIPMILKGAGLQDKYRC